MGQLWGLQWHQRMPNIFMAVLEKQMLQNTPNGLKPFEWIKFIDGIFALWTHGTESLNPFNTGGRYTGRYITSLKIRAAGIPVATPSHLYAYLLATSWPIICIFLNDCWSTGSAEVIHNFRDVGGHILR